MATDRALMQQALEALKLLRYRSIKDEQCDPTIEALRARLAEPEAEPAFWRYKGNPPIWDRHKGEWIDHFYFTDDKALAMLKDNNPTPLYTAPPTRRPLTPVQEAAPELLEALRGMLAIVNDSRGVAGYHLNGNTAEWDEFDEVDFARAIERAHKIGGNDE